MVQANLDFAVEFWLASDWVLLPQPPKSWAYRHNPTLLHLHFPNAGYVFISSEAVGVMEEKQEKGVLVEASVCQSFARSPHCSHGTSFPLRPGETQPPH